MKTVFCSLVLTGFAILQTRADLTIVYSTTVQHQAHDQRAEGTPSEVAAATNMTIKVKGDKARIDASPQSTIIIDGGSGERVNLWDDQKIIVRISPDKMGAIADMLNKFSTKRL